MNERTDNLTKNLIADQDSNSDNDCHSPKVGSFGDINGYEVGQDENDPDEDQDPSPARMVRSSTDDSICCIGEDSETVDDLPSNYGSSSFFGEKTPGRKGNFQKQMSIHKKDRLNSMGKKKDKDVSQTKSVFLIFRATVGIGVLTMPYVTQSFGIFSSIVMMIVFSVVVIYCLDLALKLFEDLNFDGSNFDEIMTRRSQEKWLHAYSVINTWKTFTAAVINCIFAVDFLKWAGCGWGLSWLCDSSFFLHIFALCLSLPFAFISHISTFTYPSLIASIVIFMTVFMICWYQGSHVISEGSQHHTTEFADFTRLGQFFGVICFSFEGMGLTFSIKGAMKNPHTFQKTYAYTETGIIALYLCLGILGALAFGDQLSEIILFFYAKYNKLMHVLAFAYSIAIFISFPMLLLPVSRSFMKSRLAALIYGPEADSCKPKHTLSRIILMLICFLVSYTGIQVLLLINLSGALLSDLALIVMPIVMYLDHYKETPPLKKYSLYSLALVAFILGVWSTVDAVEQLKNKQGW